MIKVSIVIPMYNEERYISRCLNSFKNQTYKEFEIILIDDGSKDNTIKESEKFRDNFKLTILNQKHGGPGKARNLGANKANGEILIFVDADMFFDNKFIEKLIEPIIDGKEIGTAHATELVGNLENKLARARSIIRCSYDKNNPRSGVYRAIKKDIFLKSGGFDSSKGYFDDDLSKVNNGLGALSIEEAICYHNNPETIGEGFKHSIWVGVGLMQSGHIKGYLISYKNWLIIFILLGIIASIFLISKGLFLYIPISLLVSILLLSIAKGIQRSIKEKYLSHLLFVPIVIIARGAGYLVGIVKYILKIK